MSACTNLWLLFLCFCLRYFRHLELQIRSTYSVPWQTHRTRRAEHWSFIASLPKKMVYGDRRPSPKRKPTMVATQCSQWSCVRFRVERFMLCSAMFHPRVMSSRTFKFYSFAAEEIGLRGSQRVAEALNGDGRYTTLTMIVCTFSVVAEHNACMLFTTVSHPK